MHGDTRGLLNYVRAELEGRHRLSDTIGLRLEPGTVVPLHRHHGEVHGYNLAGERKLLPTGTDRWTRRLRVRTNRQRRLVDGRR